MPTASARLPRTLLAALTLAAALSAPLTGCGGGTPQPVQFQSSPVVVRDVPEILRNTIGSEATIGGVEPVLVSGYGFVVGLHGTGGEPLPERIAATMERQLGLNGISRGNPMPGLISGDGQGMSPRELLRHPATAVVVVQAAIPPGAPVGTRFDVSIEALNASSLEGGRLWTTELRIGPPAPLGGYTTKRLANAAGEVFQNPFRQPGSNDILAARVMDGGIVTEPLELILQLDSPSHSRARQMASAINSRFPPDDGPDTSRGLSDAAVAIRVPSEYANRPDVFLQIVSHLPIDWLYRREYARRYVDAIQSDPTLARDLSWCLVGCNEMEMIRPLYNSPDIAVTLAALQAGAEMGDPLAADPLRSLGERGPIGIRAEAIRLLGVVPGGAQVDLFLREQAASPDLVLRAAAHDSLSRRAEEIQVATRSASAAATRNRPSQRALRDEANWFLSGETLQGIARRPVMGQLGAEPVLALDWAPFGTPLVYVTMHAQPRIILFGEKVRMRAPLQMSAWNDRLMILSDPTTTDFRVYFQHPRTGEATQWKFTGDVAELIAFMARQPIDGEDRPGLSLSYSEIVGALAAIHEAGGLDAEFTTERDRLAGQILAATRATQVDQRPETPTDVPEEQLVPGQLPEGFEPRVVPLTPPASEPR